MDTAQTINTVEWFFGYGGNHLGLKRVLPNLRLLAACEIEEFAIENILAKMEAGHLEAAPIWSDCKTFPWEPFVDRTHLFVASYPCQPFSAAGKRQGADDERHLWPYVHRWILRARPLLVFLENVEGHISLGLSTVISDLEEGGYKTTWGVFSAAEVGAPHQRKRVFIMAHKLGAGLEGFRADPCQDSQGRQEQDGYARSGCLRLRKRRLENANSGSTWDGRTHELGQAQAGGESLQQEREANGDRPQSTGRNTQASIKSRRPAELGDAKHDGLHGAEVSRSNEKNVRTRPQEKSKVVEQCEGAGCVARTLWPSRPGEPQHEWEPPRVVGNATSPRRPRAEDTGADCGNESQGARRKESERAGSLADSDIIGLPNPSDQQRNERTSDHAVIGACAAESCGRQAESPLGGDLDGPSGGLGYADLCESCANRTDELRLLGNGVVPATAERAFRVLFSELIAHNTQQPHT